MGEERVESPSGSLEESKEAVRVLSRMLSLYGMEARVAEVLYKEQQSINSLTGGECNER